jgi:hypothetical protein
MSYSIRFTVAILSLASGAIAQSVPATTSSQASAPESGFVSHGKYVNAFFGFALTLPQIEGVRDFTLPSKDDFHSLFGVQANLHGLTTLSVFARQKSDASPEEARKDLAKSEGASLKPIVIGGKEFWKSASQKKSSAGKMQSVTYETGINGYLLEIGLISFDSELTKQLQQSIDSISFFDPAKAAEIAGPNSVLSPAAAALRAPVLHIGQLDPGVISGDVYRNDALGFSYQFPHGWSITDKATQQKVVERGHQAAWGDSPAAAREHEDVEKCERTLEPKPKGLIRSLLCLRLTSAAYRGSDSRRRWTTRTPSSRLRGRFWAHLKERLSLTRAIVL